MALKEIAVSGLTISPQGIITDVGTLIITSTPSLKSKAEGKAVYSGSVTFTIVGASATGYDPATVFSLAPITISASAIKSKADGSLVMRVNDLFTAVAPNMGGTIGGTPTPFPESFKITNANQTKVKSE